MALARRLSNSLASSLSGVSARQAAGFAKKATGRISSPSEDREADSTVRKLLKLLEPAEEVQIELSAEHAAEWQRRAKEYSRLKMRAHRERQKELTIRLKLKNDAIAALPPDLQMAARAEPTELFPLDRMIFTDTPPSPPDSKKDRTSVRREGVRLGTKHMR